MFGFVLLSLLSLLVLFRDFGFGFCECWNFCDLEEVYDVGDEF